MADTDGTKLGTAFIDIETRLDKAQQQLRQAEGEVDQSMERIRRSAGEAGGDMEELEGASESAGVSIFNLISLAAILRKVWTEGLTATIAQFNGWLASIVAVNGALGATAALAKAVLRAFLPLTIAVVAINAVAAAFEGVAAGVDIARNSAKLLGDAMSRDTARARAGVRGIAMEIERLPLVGRAWAGQFQILAGAVRGDMDMVAEGVLNIREYLLELPVVGKLVFDPLDRIADSILGHRTAAEQVLENYRKQAEAMERVQRIAEKTNAMQQRAADEQRSLRHQIADAELEGIAAVEEAGRRRQAAARRRFDEDMANIQKLRDAEVESVRKRRDMGEEVRTTAMTTKQGQAALQEQGIEGGLLFNDDDVRRATAQAEAQIQQAMDHRRRQFQQFQLLNQEAIAQGVQKQLEAESREQLRAQDELRALDMRLQESRLRLEGRRFEAQAVAIRRNYRSQILEAERDGHDQRASLLRRLRDEEIRQVRDDERARAEARIAAQREATQGVADDLREIERDIMREGIESDTLREAFDIGTEFSDRIADATDRIADLRKEMDELRKGGVTAGEREQMTHLAQQLEMLELSRERLGTLRNMRLQGIDLGGEGGGAGQMTGSLAREIGSDRITRGEGQLRPQKVEAKEFGQMVEELTEIKRAVEGESFG